MTLKNDLYIITSEDLINKSYNLELIPDCMIYRAHFPEQPITPGVCIIQIASELLSDLLQKGVELSSVSNAKYLAVINPEENSQITYTFKKLVFYEDNSEVKVTVVVSNGETIFTKLSLVYKLR